MGYSSFHETSQLLLVLFRYIIWTTPKGAGDGFEISAAGDGSIGIAPRPLTRRLRPLIEIGENSLCREPSAGSSTGVAKP